MAHGITSVEGDLVDLINKTLITPRSPGYIKVDGVFMPAYYQQLTDAVENFEVRDDDVWVCSFPKTGTTWTQEMVWCIANDLDFEGAKISLLERFPFFEVSTFVDINTIKEQNPDHEIPDHLANSISFVEKLPSPRFIKTHLPFRLLPRQIRTGEKRPKIVYVVRNAKDTCISYFHQHKIMSDFRGDFEEFCTLFIGDSVPWAPFWDHVLRYWKKRIDENVLFLKYEDMKTDLPWVIKKTAVFLGKNLTTDQLSTLTEHLSFESMKVNPAVNNEDLVAQTQKINQSEENGKFMRNGNSDQWKTDMSPEMVERFDNWTRERLKGTRLYF